MDIKDYKNIYMVGIGGISMSGIAEILKKWGYKVSGSDGSQSGQTDWLENNGIHVNIGHNADNITSDIDYTSFCGGLLGDANGCTMTNCKNEGNISSNAYSNA